MGFSRRDQPDHAGLVTPSSNWVDNQTQTKREPRGNLGGNLCGRPWGNLGSKEVGADHTAPSCGRSDVAPPVVQTSCASQGDTSGLEGKTQGRSWERCGTPSR
jgi:hypothetical protein